MASSANAGEVVGQSHATGTFTSAESKADETVTIGFNPYLVIGLMNYEATNCDFLISVNGATSSLFLTGSTGVVTTPPNDVTYGGDGTITIGDESQTNDGVNYWIAFRQ